MIQLTANLNGEWKPLPHTWEHTVGSGHAALALRADYQAQLCKAHKELGVEHVRFHAILSDPMDTLICQDEKLLYSFFNADSIMDYLLSIGMRPFVELSFMPGTLASGSTTVFHYNANVTPPKNYDDWTTLVSKLVSHWVDRYGVAEVARWFFEVWNEPNLEAFWTGSQQDYFNLYRHTVLPIKEIDPSLRVGGPATAQNAWIPDFLAFCQHENLPVDFVTTHYYPTDAFGQIGADTITQLEHAPQDVMRQRAQEAHDQSQGKPLYYTEWNISSNPRGPLHDEPFAAAYIIHILMSMADLVQGYSFWTFSDIFSENYFPSVPFQGGFGLLNIQGIPKPAYRAFELLHKLGSEMAPLAGAQGTVEGWAVRKPYALTVLLANHALPRHPIQTELAHIRLEGCSEPLSIYVERIDQDHANPKQVWQQLGQPEYLSSFEVEQLSAASLLVKEPLPCKFENGVLEFDLDLPPHSVAAVTMELSA